MKLFNKLSWLCCSLVCLLFVVGCADDEMIGSNNQYGYLQLSLSKKGTSTRGIEAGDRLEYLRDAKKIEITLSFNNKTVIQSLNLTAVNDEAAEFGLLSEKIQLLVGNYTLTGYKIFGDKVVDDKAEILQEGYPDDEVRIIIQEDQLVQQSLDIDTYLRGLYSFVLGKDFSNYPAETRASQDYTLFSYKDIDSIEIDIALGTESPKTYRKKMKFVKGETLLSTDTMSLREGNYTVKGYRLLNKEQVYIMAGDLNDAVKIKDNKLVRDTLTVVYPENISAFQDYIALYQIWTDMGGEEWSFIGESNTPGANWMFKGRSVEDWGKQPGVTLHGNGRVSALNLGAFNPQKGPVSEAVCELTALEILWLGTHTDSREVIDQETKKIATLDKYTLYCKGVDIRKERIAIGKEELNLRYQSGVQSTMISGMLNNNKPASKYVTTYESFDGGLSNRITALPENIGNLENLTTLFVANGYVKELPASFNKLKNLTDLELFNCKFEEFPDIIAELPNLIAVNLAENKTLSSQVLEAGIDKLFSGSAKKTIQLLYLSDNNIKTVPASINNLTALGLLDLANNNITGMMTAMPATSPVQLILDNNKLTDIPDKFCITDDIESISIADNELTEFPNIFDEGPNEKYETPKMNVSGNKITKFKDGFTGLFVEELNISANCFNGDFPKALSETKSRISFIQAETSGIDCLPTESFENLESLKALNLLGNSIDSIPLTFNSECLPYLNGVDLSFNSFKRFPMVIFNVSTLNQLYIPAQTDENGKRCLKEWPEGMEQHFSMRVLTIDGNDIRKVKNFPTMINSLDISDNPNIAITIPDEICERIYVGSFKIGFDETQNIEGCPILGTNR